MDMTIGVDKNVIKEVNQFLDSGKLVNLMDREGLSFPAMAFILQAVIDKMKEVNEALEEE